MSQPADPSYQPASTPPSAPAAAPAAATSQEKDAVKFTAPYRELGALILVGAASALLFLAFVDLFVVFDGFASFFGLRAESAFGSFVGLETIVLPLGAVLLATHVKPVAKQARLITVVALVDYGVAALFGIITLFASFIHDLQGQANLGINGSFRDAFVGLLSHLVMLGLLAFAAFLVWRVWQGVYPAQRPAAPAYPQGYGYGQPPYGQPPQYAQPGQYGQPYGQPGQYGQPYGQPQYPGAYGQPGQPATYGQPARYQPAYPGSYPPAGGEPPASSPYQSYPPAGPHAPAPPSSGAPTSAAPASGGPAPSDGPADNGLADAGYDRTQVIPPGGGQPVERPDDPNSPTQKWG